MQAPEISKSIRQQILDQAYSESAYRNTIFQGPSTCQNCNCEFVQILNESISRRTYACMYCGIVFHRSSALVA